MFYLQIKVEDINNQNEESMDENISINENTEKIIAINNDSNIQLEFINVKNISQDGVEFLQNSESLVMENENLKKELTSTQEKFSILQSQVQHQAKLIELLLRLDMIKSVDDPDKREMDDLQRKIQLCFSLIDECNIKLNELSNERRRVLIVGDNEPGNLKGVFRFHYSFLLFCFTNSSSKNRKTSRHLEPFYRVGQYRWRKEC